MPRCRDRYRRRKRIARRHAQLDAQRQLAACFVMGKPIARIVEAFNFWTKSIERFWTVDFPIAFQKAKERDHAASLIDPRSHCRE